MNVKANLEVCPEHGRAWLNSALAVALFAMPSLAEVVSVGVKGGVPATDIVRTAGEIANRPYQATVSRFTLGPVVNLRLPLGFGVEIGAMYKRFDQQAGQIVVTAEPISPLQAETLSYSAGGHSWEFPFLGQYRFGLGAVHPYVEAGVSWNKLSNVFAPFRLSIASPTSAVYTPDGNSESRTGFAAGAGIEFKLPFLRLAPGVRFTRYGELHPWLPATNSVDILVGLSWP